MKQRFALPAITGLLVLGRLTTTSLHAAPADHDRAPGQSWSFQGILGRFDLSSVQRGYFVYEQVCASCHGMKHVHFNDLQAIGLEADDIKAIASVYEIQDRRDPVTGALRYRPGLPDDPFPTPVRPPGVPSGVTVPDLSRQGVVYPGGADRIYALLTGYAAPPAGVSVGKGLFYNRYAMARQTAMRPPLHGDDVRYADGTPATREQEARDVTAFLAWVARPHLEERHRTGVRVLVYLLFVAVLVFILKRRIWSNAQQPRS